MTGAERMRKLRERQRQAKPKIERCAFCSGAQGEMQRLWGVAEFGTPMICEACVKQALAAWAKADADQEAAVDQAMKAQNAAPEPKAKRPAPKAPAPKPEPTLAEQEAAFRVNKARYDAQMAAEYAVFGRPKSLVIDEIKRLLPLSDDDPLVGPILEAMLRHVGDQTDIQWGIPRRVYRKVLSDLSPNRAPGNEAAAFIRFKGWDATIKEIKKGPQEGEAVVKPNPRSIVIPDHKVKTMADHHRKRQERSEKAKAAAAKSKAKT